jgi:zinc transport system substrate-binding protein
LTPPRHAAPSPRAIHRALRFLLAAAALIPACRRDATVAPAAAERRIVCTFLPVYVFTRNIVGDCPGLRVELMIPAAIGCPHDYELSTSDAQRLQRASAVVLAGGLEGFAGEGIRRLNAAAAQIEASPGCDLIGSHAHDGPDHGGADHFNPHVWLSPRGAICQVRRIAEGLAEAFPAHRAALLANADRYVGRLEAIRSELDAAREALHRRRIVTSHDAFAYLARDLGLEVVAILSPSPRQEPSSGELAAVVRAIKSEQVAAVFFEPGGGQTVAATVAREAGVPLYELDSLTTATGDPPLDYYEQRMRRNLLTLREALK